jgi:hypothetical protein
MIRPWSSIIVLTLVVLGLPQPAAAGADESEALVGELTSLLERASLDSIAARTDESADSFVAALYMPDQQLIVVGAKYAVPALLNEKILNRKYRDVYIDLWGASDPASRIVIEDLLADGIHATCDSGQPFDIYTQGNGKPFAFDGHWKERKLPEQEYMQVFDRADAEYTRMLRALIREVKNTPQ